MEERGREKGKKKGRKEQNGKVNLNCAICKFCASVLLKKQFMCLCACVRVCICMCVHMCTCIHIHVSM